MEAVYNAEIEPHVRAAYEACKKHGLPCILSVEMKEGTLCSSGFIPEHASRLIQSVRDILVSHGVDKQGKPELPFPGVGMIPVSPQQLMMMLMMQMMQKGDGENSGSKS